MRTSSALAALLLAGCDRQPATAPVEQEAATDLVPCAHGAAPLARTCGVALSRGPDGRIVTVRNPDGGFHRLLIATDGRGVVAADGAEPARVTTVDANTIEVAIGGDRYRLPATVAAR